jgi:hypothetical protein
MTKLDNEERIELSRLRTERMQYVIDRNRHNVFGHLNDRTTHEGMYVHISKAGLFGMIGGGTIGFMLSMLWFTGMTMFGIWLGYLFGLPCSECVVQDAFARILMTNIILMCSMGLVWFILNFILNFEIKQKNAKKSKGFKGRNMRGVKGDRRGPLKRSDKK